MGSGAGRLKGRTFRLGKMAPLGLEGEDAESDAGDVFGETESPFHRGFKNAVVGGF